MNNKFDITVHTNTDVDPAERFASVRHIETDCGCDYYESGEEIDWEDANGLNINCDAKVARAARAAAKQALKA
jgi:hypothetical protein